MTDLRVLLGDAVTYSENVAEIEDVIIRLSKAQAATAALLDGYRDAVIQAELQWREIEARPDYPYSSRNDAHQDFLKEHFSANQ